MLTGMFAVALVKRIVNSIPVLNVVTRPVLDLIPAILAGPALGAAVVYGMEQGDLTAARHVVREKARHIKQEFDTVVRDLSSEFHSQAADLSRQIERSQGALESTARVARESAAELERTVLPVLEREFRHIEHHTRRAFQESNGPAGSGY